MFNIKSVKTQVVALTLAGTVALSSVLGSGAALAAPTNLAPNPSFESTGVGFGWVRDAQGTDAILGWTEWAAADGVKAAAVYATEHSWGWPGFQTKGFIPIDPEKEYTFSASYWGPENYQGVPLLHIDLYDRNGNFLGTEDTGYSAVPNYTPDEWHMKTLNLTPAALKQYPDVAGVKLNLRMTFARMTSLLYDRVSFQAVD